MRGFELQAVRYESTVVTVFYFHNESSCSASTTVNATAELQLICAWIDRVVQTGHGNVQTDTVVYS